MTAQDSLRQKNSASKTEKSTTAAKPAIKVKSKSHIPAKGKGKTKIRSNKRIINSEQVIESSENGSPARMAHDIAQNHKGTKSQEYPKRVSFIVRLILDEKSQFERTEIEHISSNRKQNFSRLNGEALVTFIKACINPVSVSKPASITSSIPLRVNKTRKKQPIGKFSFQISDIHLANSNGLIDINLQSGEPFIVNINFQIQGFDRFFRSHKEQLYDVKVYINEIMSGTTKLLATHRSTLVENVIEYTVPIKLLGLSHGLYRLFTIISLPETKVTGYRDGPTIQVV